MNGRRRWSLPAWPKRTWVYAGSLAVMAAVITVVWAAVAPALSIPTLETLGPTTFTAGGDHNVAIQVGRDLKTHG